MLLPVIHFYVSISCMKAIRLYVCVCARCTDNLCNVSRDNIKAKAKANARPETQQLMTHLIMDNRRVAEGSSRTLARSFEEVTGSARYNKQKKQEKNAGTAFQGTVALLNRAT